MKQTKITNYLANVDMLEGPVAAFIYTLCTLAPACTRPVHSRSKRARTARTLSIRSRSERTRYETNIVWSMYICLK
jgi:hypothetical protein